MVKYKEKQNQVILLLLISATQKGLLFLLNKYFCPKITDEAMLILLVDEYGLQIMTIKFYYGGDAREPLLAP